MAGTKAITKAPKVEAVSKKFKVTLQVKNGYSTIVREGLPRIDDNTEQAVEWLAKKEYKLEDIELIGEKPSNWDSVFNLQVEQPV
jgi:hypothetical protein